MGTATGIRTLVEATRAGASPAVGIPDGGRGAPAAGTVADGSVSAPDRPARDAGSSAGGPGLHSIGWSSSPSPCSSSAASCPDGPAPASAATPSVSSPAPAPVPVWPGPTVLPAGTRPSRPARRRDAPRPGGRRDAVELPPARRSVADRGRHGVVGTVPGPAGRDLRPVVAPSRAVALRRRRVAVSVVLAVVLAVLVAAAGTLLGAGTAPASGPVPERVVVTVVGPGESLSEVAHRTAPGADTDAAVARIRSLNGLAGSALTPGTPLRVPAA